VATPSAVLAMALLTGRTAQISHEDLRYLATWLVDFMGNAGVNLSAFLLKWREHSSNQKEDDDLLDQAISAWIDGGRVRVDNKGKEPVYRVRADQRMTLDYYKNNIIHFFVPASLVCTSCLANGGNEVPKESIIRDLMLASSLYRWEFMFRGGSFYDDAQCYKEAEAVFSTALKLLVTEKILRADGDRISVVERKKAFFMSDILRGFHEIYFATVSATKEKALSGASGNSYNLAKAFTDKQVSEGRFFNPEAYIRLNVQTAVQSLKEMKIISAKANAFDEGQQGDLVYRYLKAAIELK
jgi:glycerol-3-phosphate O-acyltransferase